MLDSFDGMIGILATLVREAPNYSGSVILQALSEWNTPAGQTAFTQVATLHRVLLWELASQAPTIPAVPSAPAPTAPTAPAAPPVATLAEQRREAFHEAIHQLLRHQEPDKPPAQNLPEEEQEITSLISSIHSLYKGTTQQVFSFI